MSAGVLPGHPLLLLMHSAGHFPYQGFLFLILQMSVYLWPPIGSFQILRSFLGIFVLRNPSFDTHPMMI